jgi:hypothetical protein
MADGQEASRDGQTHRVGHSAIVRERDVNSWQESAGCRYASRPQYQPWARKNWYATQAEP